MINLREHFKLTALYTLFAAFPPLLQLVVYPIIEGSNRLGAEDFGYLAITEAIISLVFIICTYGMSSGLVRFYYDEEKNSSGYNRLVSSVLSSIIIRGMFIMGVVFMAGNLIGNLFPQPALQNFSEYGPSLVIAGLNRSIFATLLALYRNEKRLKLFAVVTILSGLFRASLQLAGVLLYDMSFMGYVHGTAVGGSVVSVAIVAYTYYRSGFHLNRQTIKSLTPFVRPLFFTDLIIWGLLFADRFFLLANPGELGIYDNTMKFAIGVQLIIQGLTNAIQPEIFGYLKEGFKKRISEIRMLTNLYMAESIIIITLAIIPVMIFITIFYETELQLSSGLVLIVFARFILSAQYNILSLPVMFAKKTKIFFYTNCGALLINLSINFLITPILGYYGAIIAFFAAYLFQVTLFAIFVNQKLAIKLNQTKVIYLPLSIVLFAVALEILKVFVGVGPFIIAAIFVLGSLGSLLFLYRAELSGYLFKPLR